ncbi:hypothetical protein KCP77_10320 [Salmonella enterica subsp. enterica]|nr:hypothetical protein KCP77_10320 [Salmonella enterica subsp. enterica]
MRHQIVDITHAIHINAWIPGSMLTPANGDNTRTATSAIDTGEGLQETRARSKQDVLS